MNEQSTIPTDGTPELGAPRGDLLAQVRDLARRVAILEAAVLHGRGAVDEPRRGPYQPHSSTSKLAALSNAPRSGTQRARILTYLVEQAERGATRQEVGQALLMSDDSVRPRIVELIEGGWAVKTDRQRRTSLGEMAEVIVATEKAWGEHGLKIEEARGAVSPGPVVSDGSDWSRGGGPGGPPAGVDTTSSGPSETPGLFDPPKPQPLRYGQEDAA